jgi:hypothetical protein
MENNQEIHLESKTKFFKEFQVENLTEIEQKIFYGVQNE